MMNNINSKRCIVNFGIVIVQFIGIFLNNGANGLGLDKYQGYKVLRAYPAKPHHINMMKRLESSKPDKMEIIREPIDSGDPLDLLASPAVLEDFLSLCQMLDIPVETVVPDLPSAIVDQISIDLDKEDDNENFALDRYHQLKNINKWLYEMQGKYPDLIKVFSLGYSWEGRTMNVAQISRRTDDEIEKKPAIWLDAGIHANEWVGPSTMLYFINELATKSEDDEEIRYLLDNFVFYIMPVFNVDGYDYTWKTDRFWRKSRSVHDNSKSCVGVDMNRNWDVKWTAQSARNEVPCSRVYAGPYPFSEPESIAVEAFLRQHNNSILAYIAYHSYSQYWMTPYGFTNKRKPSNYKDLSEISQKAVEAIAKVHGTKYKTGSISQLVGETTGSSVDYVYTHLSVKYSFGVELRDDGVFGTLLPPDQIIPNAEESFAALKIVGQLIKEQMDRDKQGHQESVNDVEQGRPY